MIDRQAIHNHISPHNLAAANRLDERFMALGLALPTTPYMGRAGKLRGTRELTAHANYRVIYRIDTDIIYILNIVHNARDWPRPSRNQGNA